MKDNLNTVENANKKSVFVLILMVINKRSALTRIDRKASSEFRRQISARLAEGGELEKIFLGTTNTVSTASRPHIKTHFLNLDDNFID